MDGYIGILEDGTPFIIDIDRFFESHVAILSKTGGGKSYLGGVLVEELAKNNVPVLIIDTHGEYRTLIKPNNDTRMNLFSKFKISPKSFARQVRIFSTHEKGDLQFRLSDKRLKIDDFQNLYPGKLKDSHKEHLHRIIFETKKKKYSIDDIASMAEKIKGGAKYTLLNVLKQIKSLGLFSDTPTKSTDLVKAGYITIFDLKLLPKRLQVALVASVLKKLFASRKKGTIPPFILMVEEAHIYAPQVKSEISSEIMKDIAAEGRKFGLCLVVVTQRPSRITKDVLSQPQIQIYLKVTNPRDVQAIYESVENVTPELRAELKKLNRGQCLISGVDDDKTVKVNVRIRHTKHGGKSKTFNNNQVERGK